MLKEFLKEQREIPDSMTLRFPEFAAQSIVTFDGLVDLLRDEDRFPNQEINELVTLTWRLIGNKDIPLVLDQWRVPSLSFVVLGEGKSRTPFFVMPTNFIDQVREDTIMQTGAISFMSSQGKDYYSGRLETDGSEIVNRRARAYEAETLLTIKEMSQDENITLNFNPYQEKVLERFPEGIKSLPKDLVYPTPTYKPQNYKLQ